MAERRRSFGPVVLLGAASAVLAAVAGGKPWFRLPIDDGMLPGAPEPDTGIDSPLALALALVVLAGWGVVLVTRGRVRRALALVALLAALGYASCVVAAPFTLPGDLRERLGESGITANPTPWFAFAVLAAVAAVVSTGLAVRLAPTWPEMGARYDAPRTGSGTAATAGPVDPTDSRATWDALDDGVDPTDPSDPPAP